MASKDKKEKDKKSYAKKLLPWIIVAIMGYTIADFVLQYFTQVEVSPTLTQMYFAFWTFEILSIANIKVNKVKALNKKKSIIKDAVDSILSDDTEDSEESEQ
jgi:hypothetical protein